MLKLGEQKIKGLYLGEQKLKKAYLGDNLVFSGAKSSRLPEGYTELEYIFVDNNVTIPGGKDFSITTGTTRVVMDIAPQEKVSYTRYLFYSNKSDLIFTLYQNNKLNSMACMAGRSSTYRTFIYDLASGKRVTVDMDTPNKVLKIEDSHFDILPLEGEYSCGYINIVGGYENHADYRALKMYVYSAKVYVSGEQKGNYIPCKNSNGQCGLFNLVNNTFFTSSCGTISPGPAIEA